MLVLPSPNWQMPFQQLLTAAKLVQNYQIPFKANIYFWKSKITWIFECCRTKCLLFIYFDVKIWPSYKTNIPQGHIIPRPGRNLWHKYSFLLQRNYWSRSRCSIRRTGGYFLRKKKGASVRKNSTSRVVQGSRGKWTGSKNYSTPFGAPGTFQHHFPLFIFNPMQQTSGHILPVFLIVSQYAPFLEGAHFCLGYFLRICPIQRVLSFPYPYVHNPTQLKHKNNKNLVKSEQNSCTGEEQFPHSSGKVWESDLFLFWLFQTGLAFYDDIFCVLAEFAILAGKRKQEWAKLEKVWDITYYLLTSLQTSRRKNMKKILEKNVFHSFSFNRNFLVW